MVVGICTLLRTMLYIHPCLVAYLYGEAPLPLRIMSH